jgi:8-oxo-dGTP pyrophosphatase MutT (NUDIX family)
MSYTYRGNQKNFCTNCGGNGHVFRNCIAPVTSYGVIMVRPSKTFCLEKSLITNGNVTGLEKEPLEFLLIQRRDSLGFIELIRGRYKISDIDYIRLHLGGITADEQTRYRDGPFDVLWNSMWGLNHTHLYKNEFETAMAKWQQIHEGITDENGKVWTIDDLIASAGPAKHSPEWGFPKGRRDAQESDYICAMREMEEETGVNEKEVICINNMEPLVESFFGSNHVHYCHKYFIVWVPPTREIHFDTSNDHMRREIGDIQWFSVDEALAHLRPENIEKKEVLLRAASLFRNLCPFPIHR